TLAICAVNGDKNSSAIAVQLFECDTVFVDRAVENPHKASARARRVIVKRLEGERTTAEGSEELPRSPGVASKRCPGSLSVVEGQTIPIVHLSTLPSTTDPGRRITPASSPARQSSPFRMT